MSAPPRAALIGLVAYTEQSRAENAEEQAALGDVPETFLNVLEGLKTANDQIASSSRRIAIYLVKERGVSRKRVAEALGVTAVTVWRWVREQEDGGAGSET